jgi:hypothetical protein
MIITIPYHLYPLNLMFAFGESDSAVRRAIRPYGVKRNDHCHKLDAYTRGKCIHYDSGFTLIRMKELPQCTETFAVLQHEIFHAVVYLMQYIGAELSDASNENFAYTIQYVTEQVYKKIPYFDVRQLVPAEH